MCRYFCLLFALSVAVAGTAVAQSTSAPVGVAISEAAIKEQVGWTLAKSGIGGDAVKCLLSTEPCTFPSGSGPKEIQSRLAETKAFDFFVPKEWSEVQLRRPKLVWLPALVIPTFEQARQSLEKVAVENGAIGCRSLRAEWRECTTLLKTVAVGAIESNGISMCQSYVGPNRQRISVDCEPLEMTFGRTSYVRVAATSPNIPPVPWFRDPALLFQYQLRSTNKAVVTSPDRLSEMLGALAQASEGTPLKLSANRAIAPNIVVAQCDWRYSQTLKLWEQIDLSLVARTELRTMAASPQLEELSIEITGSLFALVSEQNVASNIYRHEPSQDQMRSYRRSVANNVVDRAKALCAGYSGTLGGQWEFAVSSGPMVRLQCQRR